MTFNKDVGMQISKFQICIYYISLAKGQVNFICIIFTGLLQTNRKQNTRASLYTKMHKHTDNLLWIGATCLIVFMYQHRKYS